jgi:hypothetical protein
MPDTPAFNAFGVVERPAEQEAHMPDPIERTAAAPSVPEELRQDLDAFEAMERQLLSDERRERARQLAERFAALRLTLA